MKITRRRVCASIAATMLGACVVEAFAQAPARVWRIGILNPRSQDSAGSFKTFYEGLREIGYVEGRHFNVYWLHANNDPDRLAQLAAELVKLGVDVIVTNGTPAVGAIQKSTRAIPVVALSFGDPVRSGFAASLARPGGNVTGFTNVGLQIAPKRVELLASAVPTAARIAYLVNTENPALKLGLPDVEAVARKVGRELLPVKVRAASDLPDAFALMVRERAAALVVADDNMLLDHWRTVSAHALKAKLPTIMPWPQAAEGALLAYRAVYPDFGRRSALLVERILKGAKAGELPIEQPMGFRLVVNLKIAKTLGVSVPQSMLLQATRVIE